ncbi:MAG: helix-turn-helix transcriptional regulator [Defluviitaleaceae bacterium]|nr:helix-turn-helix transcriptional regulator [Defluviitaleaceae bacterium]
MNNLIDKVLALSGGHEIEVIDKLKVEVENFLKSSECDEAREALILLDFFILDRESDDVSDFERLAEPIFKRLNETSDWSITDVRILTRIIGAAGSIHEVFKLAEEALEALDDNHNQKYNPNYASMRISLHSNVLLRCLRELIPETMIGNYDYQVAVLRSRFEDHFDGIIAMCKSDIKRFFIPHQAARVRLGVFLKDFSLVLSAFSELREAGHADVVDILKAEINGHMLYDDAKQEKENLPALLGFNMRKMREHLGVSREDMADLLDITPAHIMDIEDGKVVADTYILYGFAGALGVSTAVFSRPIPDNHRGMTIDEAWEDINRFERHSEEVRWLIDNVKELSLKEVKVLRALIESMLEEDIGNRVRNRGMASLCGGWPSEYK